MGKRREKPKNNGDEFERKFKKHGLIAGTDEVGVGCLAGPLVAAAVILNPDKIDFQGIVDSKQLKPIEREELYQPIIDICIACSWYKIEAADVEELGQQQASILAMNKAVEFLEVTPGAVLVDHYKLDLPMKCVPIDDGDNQSISIAAASILAKVRRDRYMKKLAEKYPQYGWHTNMGYGTPVHKKAILEHGLTKYHRRTFCKKTLSHQ